MSRRVVRSEILRNVSRRVWNLFHKIVGSGVYLFVRWAPLLPICGVLGGGVFEFWEFHFQIDDAFVAHTYIFLCPVDSSWQLHGSQKKKGVGNCTSTRRNYQTSGKLVALSNFGRIDLIFAIFSRHDQFSNKLNIIIYLSIPKSYIYQYQTIQRYSLKWH